MRRERYALGQASSCCPEGQEQQVLGEHRALGPSEQERACPQAEAQVVHHAGRS